MRVVRCNINGKHSGITKMTSQARLIIFTVILGFGSLLLWLVFTVFIKLTDMTLSGIKLQSDSQVAQVVRPVGAPGGSTHTPGHREIEISASPTASAFGGGAGIANSGLPEATEPEKLAYAEDGRRATKLSDDTTDPARQDISKAKQADTKTDTTMRLILEPATTQRSNSVAAVRIILSVESSANCEDTYFTDVYYRKNSTAMRSSSFLSLDKLIDEHEKCDNSVFQINNTLFSGSTNMLDQRRKDEAKYYLLQRSVKKQAIPDQDD